MQKSSSFQTVDSKESEFGHSNQKNVGNRNLYNYKILYWSVSIENN